MRLPDEITETTTLHLREVDRAAPGLVAHTRPAHDGREVLGRTALRRVPKRSDQTLSTEPKEDIRSPCRNP